MQPVASILRKLRGVTLLLTLWLPIMAAAPASADTRSIAVLEASATLFEVVVGEAAVEAELLASEEEAGGPDDEPVIFPYAAPKPSVVRQRAKLLPPATGPPQSRATRHFQARAPPV